MWFCVLTHYSTQYGKFPVRPRCQRSMYPPHLPFLFAASSPLPSTDTAVFTLFGSFVTLSSRYPSRTARTHRLGCLGRMCSLPLPFPLTPMSLICNRSRIKLQAVLTLSARHPAQATLVCRLGCLGGAARGFSSHLVALVIRLSSVLNFRKAWLVFFFLSSWGSLYLSR